ncbi:hypothetical protein ACFOGJ_25455 [Marinibaculum pumilum]|uniref:Uncharacterized protein n=1 Tax=Marinibaculum pumilum TaxID=1766165 RepID=A0ABV7L7L9_9PROT
MASRPVLWLALGVLLLLAGSLAVTAAVFELSPTGTGPDRIAPLPDLPLRGVDLQAQPAPPAAAPPPPALRRAMAAVAARPQPLAPLTPAEMERFRGGGEAGR